MSSSSTGLSLEAAVSKAQCSALTSHNTILCVLRQPERQVGSYDSPLTNEESETQKHWWAQGRPPRWVNAGTIMLPHTADLASRVLAAGEGSEPLGSGFSSASDLSVINHE